MTLASLTKLLVLLLPIAMNTLSFNTADLDNKSAGSHSFYTRKLVKSKQNVPLQVEVSRDLEEKKKKMRTIVSPLSASLPNHESLYILERLQSINKKGENTIEEEENRGENVQKEKRVDEKLFVLLNSLDELPFDINNGSTAVVEGSGEEATDPSEATLTTEKTTDTEKTTGASNSTVRPSVWTTATNAVSTTVAPSSTVAPVTVAPSFSTEELPRRAHGVIISHASPHSPSLSPMNSNHASTLEQSKLSTTMSSSSSNRKNDQDMEGLSERDERREPMPTRRISFNPTANHTAEECRHLTQLELVRELKQKGTYNPDLMAWDVFGILRFLDRTIAMQMRNRTRGVEAAERNIETLSRILGELDVSCDVKTENVRARMQNMTMVEPRRSILSPHIRRRSKREAVLEELTRLMADLDEAKMKSTTTSRPATTTTAPIYETIGNRQKLIGESHVVPFGCDRRGTEEDGYLRLCSACQSIRRLPDSFFPPFINEVTCDEDNACLYFYDYPHGRCKQKHMNFVVLRNVGTQECQIWRKFNLNVRVSCECFVDEMSFFAKYV
ncbi:hypothetical protein PFISCL1PPCAC_28264 [Pristionchus fissidentatus]|uniref:Spaetzle domain-containing protein n=1 Tax=Pristionchus fissidentatus TaxID=1538716 RepID=A0AAV5WXP4_9BILA|nr:hypothetical protein PFISCL1PPCAC_28264 [Pristionchus fissidentatus]